MTRRLFCLLIPSALVLLAVNPIEFLKKGVRLIGNGRVTASWDANSESDLAGYKLYWGIASGVYTFNEDLGMTTSTSLPTSVVSQLRPFNTTWYFAVTAYDTNNNESPFSSEVSLTVGKLYGLDLEVTRL